MEIENKNQIDVLSIGDTTCEPFIKLEKAEVHCGIDKVGCTITLPFGSKIPFESKTIVYGVGNSANAAVAIARLGLKSALATELGADEFGEKSLQNFRDENVDISLANTHAGLETNYHYVLWYPPERTILVNHKHYPRALDVAKFNILAPKYIYLSSLPADSLDYHAQLIDWLKKNRNTKLVYQPGTFQMKLGTEALKPLYTLCHLFVVNKEEAEYILGVGETKIQELLEKIQKLGPEIVSITDGPKGAYLRCKDENSVYKNYFMPIYPDIAPPFERTGAGDAYASTFTAALCMGKTPLEAFKYAPVNSMNVVQEIGAQKGLLTIEKIEDYLKNAPSEYKAIEI